MGLKGLFKDEYALKARLIPAALIALPYAFLANRLLLDDFPKSASLMASVACVSFFWCAGAWVFSMIIRGMGKCAEDRLFANGTRFPTTEILLWSDDFLSMGMKESLHERIKSEFGISLLSKKREEANPEEARKTARDAVNLIRPVVGRGVHTQQYNIHYGACRNFASSAWFGVVGFGVLAALWFHHNAAPFVAIAGMFALLYFGVFLYRNRLMRTYGYRYAHVLLSEYLSSQAHDSVAGGRGRPPLPDECVTCGRAGTLAPTTREGRASARPLEKEIMPYEIQPRSKMRRTS